MRIDLNGPTATPITNEQRHNVAAAKHVEQQVATDDQTTFSTDAVEVKSLVAKALQLPEVRQEKVDALRQAIRNGEYEVEPSKIADALIKETHR